MNFIEKIRSVLINNGASFAINAIGGLVFNLLFAKTIGLDLFGELNLILSISTLFFSFTTFGVSSSFTRAVLNQEDYYHNFIFLTFFFVIAIGIIICIPVAIFYSQLQQLINVDKTLFFIAVFSNYIFNMPYQMALAILDTNQHTKPAFFSSIQILCIKFVTLILLMYIKCTITIALLLYLVLPQAASFIILYYYLLRDNLIKFKLSLNRIDIKNIQFLYLYAFKLLPMTISELVLSNYSIFYLNKYSSVIDISVYRISLYFIQIGILLPSFIGKSILPMLTKLFIQNKENLFNFYSTLFIKISHSIMMIFAIAIILFGQIMLKFTNDSIHISKFIILLIALIVYILGNSIIGSSFSAINKPLFISLALVISAIANVASNQIFKMRFSGLIVVFISLFISYIIAQLFLILNLFKLDLIKISIKKYSIDILFILFSFTFINIKGFNYSISQFFFITLFFISLIIVYFVINMKFNFYTLKEKKQILYFKEKLFK